MMQKERFPAQGEELAGSVICVPVTEPYTATSASYTKPEMVQRRYTLGTARTSRGNTEPSPRPIRASLEGGPQGRLCRISLSYYDTTLCPTSISHREQI